ncbi:MAG: potassium channel protein [Ardenticatenaceae bacterium]|nr:potassium channel protein [Ardenticatenaceae bacterium]
MVSFRRSVWPLVLLVVLLFVAGTVGYMVIEGWSLPDAFYMTAITLTTVGFGEVRPLSTPGRIFTVLIIMSGVGSVAYGFGRLGEYFLTGHVAANLRSRRMMRTIDKLQNHIIVCGYGRVGKSAALTLRDGKRPVVVIDNTLDRIETAQEDGFVVLHADATRDEALIQAGIGRAWGLVVGTGDDSRNLFIVLSARALNGNLYIVARTVDAANEQKMIRAGANRVVSPYQIGGKHMANIVIRPHVTDFLDVVTLDGGLELWLEELVIQPNSVLIGQTVGDSNIRRRTGVTLVALLRRAGGTVMPDADTVLQAGDELIVLGTREQLTSLEELTGVQPLDGLRNSVSG